MPVPDPNQNQQAVPVSGSTVPPQGTDDGYRPLASAAPAQTDDGYRPLASTQDQTPPAPEEKPGALHRLWDWANRGIISKDTMVKAMTGMSPDDLNEALSPFADETPVHAALREFTRGTLQDIGALGSSLTSPLSVGTIVGGELIKGAQSTTQVAAALKGVRASEASVSAADVAYTARITEATNATAQADRAVTAARAAEAAETAGKGSRAATIAAQNTASEAVANAGKARQALQEAQAARGEAAVQAARATYAHQEAVKAASLIPIPGQVAKAAPVVKTLGGLFAAQGIEQAAAGRQEGETPEDEIERRLMGLGFATLAAEGFRGSKMDVPLSEVPARAVDFGEAGVEMTKKAAQKASDLVSRSIGISQDFDTVVKNISKPSAKQYQNYIGKIENVSDDLKAILNANPNVETPDDFARSIDGHIKRQEGVLQTQAGATKNSPEPVVPDILNRVSQSLDKFFDENRGAYGSDTDVAEAKKKLLERVLQARNNQQMQPPNLFEAENIRWALGNESKPQYAVNATPTTSAYKAGAAEVANVLRDAIDESYNNKGVKDVKEWRQKEANLIDIRDRLKLAQAKADALGQPGIWKSLFAKVGTPSAIIAAAFGHPIGAGMLAAGITGDYIHQLATNPNSLVQRAVKLAARAPSAEVTQPTVSPWVSPKPPEPPAQLGPVPPTGAPVPPATPAPAAKTEEFVPPSRENTDLHSDLATHYGKSIKNTNYAELEQRFHNDIKTKLEHSVALDSGEKTILGKINAADGKDAVAAQKAQEKAAKEQAKLIKEGEETYRPVVGTEELSKLPQTSIDELKKIAAEVPGFFKDLSIEKTPVSSGSIGQLNYQGKPFAYLGIPLDEFETQLGPVKKILGKATKALTAGQDADAETTFKTLTRMPQTEYRVPAGGLLPNAPNEMSTPEETNYHELGHVFTGHLNGFKATEIGSRLHPGNPQGATAFTSFDFEDLGDKNGHVTRNSLGNKLPALLETLMGGAAADEVHSGLDRFNPGTDSDRLMAYKLLTQALGLGHDEAADMIEAATDRAAEKLKHPVTLGILRENAGVREEDLSETHLFSKERLESMRAEHDRRMEEYEKQNRAGGSRASRKGYEGLDTRAAQAGGRPVAERVSAAQTAVLTPAERSTGNPEFDKTIKTAGATPGGIQKGVEGIVPDQVLFHDPETGSTLAVSADDVTENRIKQAMTESRKKFKISQTAQPEDPFEKAVKHYGVTDDVKKAGYIGSDGRMLDFSAGLSMRSLDHGNISEIHDAENPREQFVADTGAMRVLHSPRQNYVGIHFDFDHPPTNEQLERLLPLLNKGTTVEADVSSTDTGKTGSINTYLGGKMDEAEDMDGLKRIVKDAKVRANQKVQDHLDNARSLGGIKLTQTATDWAQRAEQQAKESGGGFTIDPRTGQTPDSGYMIEASPESRQVLDHSATAEDIRKFYDTHKALFDQHPNLHVGGYQNELNVSANVPNLEAAKQVAGKLDQRSIWDVKNQKEIDTGGKGEQTSFPGYNLDTRLAELNRTSDQQKGLISTRLPASKKSTENPITQDLTVGRDSIEQVPGMADKMAKLVRKYPGFKVPENIKDPAKVLDRFVGHVKENLKRMYEAVPPETQAANGKWYDSANNLAQRLAEKYGKTLNQMAGAIAAMSPQKDWDQNVSLANRVNDIYHTQQDTVATPEMLDKAAEIASRKTGKSFKPMEKALAGKTLASLTDPVKRAAWVRLYDEAHNPREYESIDPATGEGRGTVYTSSGQKQRVSWGGLNEIGKALSILQDGSRENISDNLGDAHKVRNFYNNIVDPNNPRGDVTIDTHAVAAGLVRPLGGNSTEVLHNFGAGGAPGSVVNGINGTYPLYADAYREAAKELGIQPRQLQSVVWEHVRNIFPGEIKRQPSLVDAVNQTWKDYADRKISLDKAHEQVRQLASEAVQGLTSKRQGGKMSAQDFLKAMGQGGLFALGGEEK